MDSATSCQTITRDEIAHTLGQDPEHTLMGHFEPHLRELGEQVDGSFLAFARSGTAEELATDARVVATWFDVSPYGDEPVPFFKRAQIAAADLALSGLADPTGLDRLTLFADNLVPHVLRLDGVLTFDDDLVARIEAEELLEHDSPEEVEIRACALHAVELLVAGAPRTRPRPPSTTCSGTAAASRATRRAPATVPAPPPTDLVRIEGFHALKHALRFGAEIVEISGDRARMASARGRARARSRAPADGAWRGYRRVRRRPPFDLERALRAARPRHLPRGAPPSGQSRCGDPRRRGRRRGGGADLGRAILGTRTRSAAPPGCSSRSRSRRVDGVAERPDLIAIDPEGEERAAPRHAILAFGGERYGLSEELKASADALIRIPMRAGVSSLNLATAVAAMLYAGSG